jgi:hypothetical protein
MLRIVRPNDAGQEKRPPKNSKPCRSLTDAERKQLRVLLRNLHRHFGSWPCLAEAMGVRWRALSSIASGKRRGSPGILLRAARIAGLPVERVLSGKLDLAGRCPTCGRST